MQPIDWNKLTVAFTSEVKTRPDRAINGHKCERPCRVANDPSLHTQLSYVDARDVMNRLDRVLAPTGWKFEVQPVPGTPGVAKGRLTIFDGDRELVREDFGYENNGGRPDAQVMKEAASDAIKRCAVQFGIGRHLYGSTSAAPVQTASTAQLAELRSLADQLGGITEPVLEHMAGDMPLAQAPCGVVADMILRAKSRLSIKAAAVVSGTGHPAQEPDESPVAYELSERMAKVNREVDAILAAGQDAMAVG